VHLLLCDDHLLFIEILQPALEALGHTVDVATSVDAALATAARRRPDVCLLDLRFPRESGVEGVRRLRAQDPDLKIVVLSAVNDPAELSEAVAAGAVGLAYKMRPLEETVRTIERVHRGEAVVDVAVLHGLVEPRQESAAERLARFLTTREREVLRLLVQGRSTKELAIAMGVSQSTIRTHIQSMLWKLGVHSRIEAVAFAVRHRIVELPEGHGTEQRAPPGGQRRAVWGGRDAAPRC
jgi:two-component system nitrate/nitrite response regulator NarL